MSDLDALAGQRKGLAERFGTVPVAYSTDGREVGFAGPLDLGIEVGGLALVDSADGAHLVAQVREQQVVERGGQRSTSTSAMSRRVRRAPRCGLDFVRSPEWRSCSDRSTPPASPRFSRQRRSANGVGDDYVDDPRLT